MGDDDRWLALGLAGVLAPAVLVVAVLALALGSGGSLPAGVAWPLGLAVLALTALRVVARLRLLRRVTSGWPGPRRRRLRRLLVLVAVGYAGVLGVAAVVGWATGDPGWAVVTVAGLLVLALLGVVLGALVSARAAPH